MKKMKDVAGTEDAPSTPKTNWSDPHSLRLSDAVYFSNSSDIGGKRTLIVVCSCLCRCDDQTAVRMVSLKATIISVHSSYKCAPNFHRLL